MAHAAYLTTDTVAEEIRPLFQEMEKKGGVSNMFRLLAHAPEALTTFLAFNKATKKVKLDPKLLALAYLTAVRITGCRY